MYLASTSYLMVCQSSLWSFYSCTYKCLTLQMLCRRNLTLKSSPVKLLLLFVSSFAFLFRFCVSEDFLKVYPNKLYIYVKELIWRTPSKQRPSLATWLGEFLPTHWSWLARVRAPWARLGAHEAASFFLHR